MQILAIEHLQNIFSWFFGRGAEIPLIFFILCRYEYLLEHSVLWNRWVAVLPG